MIGPTLEREINRLTEWNKTRRSMGTTITLNTLKSALSEINRQEREISIRDKRIADLNKWIDVVQKEVDRLRQRDKTTADVYCELLRRYLSRMDNGRAQKIDELIKLQK